MKAVTKASLLLLLSSALSICGYRIDYIKTKTPSNSNRVARHSFQQPKIINNPYSGATYLPPPVNRPSRSDNAKPKKEIHLEQQSYAPTEHKNIYYQKEAAYGDKLKPFDGEYYGAGTFQFEMPAQEFDLLGTDEFKNDMENLEKYNFHDHGHKESHGEVHYHEHKHLHKHDHKQEHKHDHHQDHKHDHDHKHWHDNKHDHSHKHSHDHQHKNEHKHHHGHHHDHKHGHKHDHKHDHKHHQDHKHDHHHGHKHDHGHKHHHGHEHKHDHKNEHKHDHKHTNDHKHHHDEKHHHGHKHHHEAHHSH